MVPDIAGWYARWGNIDKKEIYCAIKRCKRCNEFPRLLSARISRDEHFGCDTVGKCNIFIKFQPSYNYNYSPFGALKVIHGNSKTRLVAVPYPEYYINVAHDWNKLNEQ